MEEAVELKQLLYNLSKQRPPGSQLQHLFKPLHNRDVNLSELQLSKGSVKNREFRDPKLRIYAIRISKNAYVVTGGAIKLTHLMEDRPHTKRELEKLNVAKSWLKSEGISYPEDLKELL